MNSPEENDDPQAGREKELDLGRLPRHVAIIMDGNGRWAKNRGLSRIKGHQEGTESVRVVVRTSCRLGLEALTLYAFSTENWNRPKIEVKALMEILRRFLKSEEAEMLDQGIRLMTIGQTERLPNGVQKTLKQVMDSTAGGREMVLNLCLSYGSRNEIALAASEAARRCVAGSLHPDQIDEALFGALLQTAALPEVELIIRTSGEHRLSNFLLWQAAYAELVMTPTLWPDFREAELLDALAEFQRRERRFGLISEQLGPGTGR